MLLLSGIHAVIKRDAQNQFGRLPLLTSKGETYYLDLLVWRANRNLEKAPLFHSFAKDLWLWTHQPLEDWSHIIPVMEEEEEEEEVEEAVEEAAEDAPWFIPADDVDEADLAEDFVILRRHG